MRRPSRTGSISRSCAAIALSSLACSPAACARASGPRVLTENELLRHLPQGTQVRPPGRESFEVAPPDGMWLVPAGYLARVFSLLGEGPAAGAAAGPNPSGRELDPHPSAR